MHAWIQWEEGGVWHMDRLENGKAIRFLSNTGLEPLGNQTYENVCIKN